jgi:hypothetical protein
MSVIPPPELRCGMDTSNLNPRQYNIRRNIEGKGMKLNQSRFDKKQIISNRNDKDYYCSGCGCTYNSMCILCAEKEFKFANIVLDSDFIELLYMHNQLLVKAQLRV